MIENYKTLTMITSTGLDLTLKEAVRSYDIGQEIDSTSWMDKNLNFKF